MTIAEAIAIASRSRPNHKATDEEIIAWLAKLDGKVKKEIMGWCHGPLRFTPYTPDVDRTTELLVEAPYDSLYWHYLAAQIDLLQGDTDSYQTERALCDEEYVKYQGWYMRSHRPIRKWTRYW